MKRLTQLFTSVLRSRALLSAALIVAVAASAQAGPVSFTVGGTTFNVAKFDQSPGNVLAVNATTLINAAGPTGTTAPFTSYYQANVILEDANGRPLPVPGQVTVLARFNEIATNSIVNGLPQSTFTLAANQTGSYFNFYFNPTVQSNDLTGKGFGPDVPGSTLIYSSTVPSNAPNGQFQLLQPPTSTQLFDQSATAATNGYDGKMTIVGSGSTALNLGTSFVNTGFFTGGVDLTSTLNFTSTNQTPFGTASPSQMFFDVTANAFVMPSLPAINGVFQSGGPARQDFQFLADGNSFFSTPNVVPEPASVAMTLMGLVGTGAVALRRRKAVTA